MKAGIALDRQPGRGALTALAALVLLAGCTGPTRDQATLKTIQTESLRLVATHPIEAPRHWAEIPKSQWPPAIASIRPYSVAVFPWGVDILMKPDFDGGWGYEVPLSKQQLPMPASCYTEPGEGVFWHGPC